MKEEVKEKLKDILHRRKKSTPTQSPRASYEHPEERSPRAAQFSSSPSQPRQPVSDHAQNDSHHAGRQRPVSASYNDGRTNNPMTSQTTTTTTTTTTNRVQSRSSDLNRSIADDYKSYLPVLDSVDDSNTGQKATLGGDRRPMKGGSGARHGEQVADSNVARYRTSSDANRAKPLPSVPSSHPGQGAARDDTQLHRSRRRPQDSDSEGVAPQPPPHKFGVGQDMAVKPPPGLAITTDNQHVDGGEDWKAKQRRLLEGVVDLKNTVDMDRDVQLAPAVVHEVIKPHEHEVIQRELFREIHNYTYYHRLQPVLQTEVLPPRHFIPNPNGEGLIEISADELPHRTGKNRWWDIVQKETELPEAPFQWRTEPEVIEGKPYITDEGFERRETTIIYPPTLEDMSNYRGMVQPVHFDHKTGERWLGEITTVDKLNEELAQAADADFMTMKEVTANLPEMPESPTVKRKPVGRDSL